MILVFHFQFDMFETFSLSNEKDSSMCGEGKVEKVGPILDAPAWDVSPLWRTGCSQPISRSENLGVLLHFGSRVLREESEHGALQARAENQKITPKLIAEQKPHFQVRECIQRLKIKPLDQASCAVCTGTMKRLPLIQSWKNTTGHRYLSLFKIDMFLKSWLHNTFRHVELYFFTDFSKRVENIFQ